MKTTSLLAAAVLAVASVSLAVEPATQPTSAPATTQPTMNLYQQASYGIGYDLGRNVKNSNIAFDPEVVIQGLKEGLAGSTSKVTPDQLDAAMAKIKQEMMANMQAQQAKAGEANVKDGDAFRAENAKKPGVKTTASGLQVETLKEGTGTSPTAADTVKVHYTGKLINGTTFDSSVDRGQPISFPLNGVIAGWTEGLQLMKVGGKSKLVIPPNLGYGPGGTPDGSIPPNATLVFEVELLDIVKK
ncbi:MAG: FKBP-type peptidyl-prolyl cis-trans isomerase [Tepidisphaeraceae bacterium]